MGNKCIVFRSQPLCLWTPEKPESPCLHATMKKNQLGNPACIHQTGVLGSICTNHDAITTAQVRG